MSQDEHISTSTHDCGGDAAAYILGALDPLEVEAFERHLEGCVVCRDELAALGDVATALPMAAPRHQAPRSLRQRVLTAVRQEARPMASERMHRKTVLRMPGWAWRGVALASLCVTIALAVFAGLELSSGSQARVIQARVMGISGNASLHIANGHRELILRHLSPPPPGDIYEIWLKRPRHAPAPTNVLFSVTSSGQGEIALPDRLHGATQMMVTPEPSGGSPFPTHPPVIVARLT